MTPVFSSHAYLGSSLIVLDTLDLWAHWHWQTWRLSQVVGHSGHRFKVRSRDGLGWGAPRAHVTFCSGLRVNFRFLHSRDGVYNNSARFFFFFLFRLM